MKQGQFRVRLRPLHGGAYTQAELRGAVPTAISPQQMQLLRRMAEMITAWSGWPVGLALYVAPGAGGWCDWWADRLQSIPARHLEVRFVPPRGRRSAQTPGERDEQP